jgi:hypothetical protein
LEAGFHFHLQVKKGGKGQKPYLLGPLVELASDLDSYNIQVPGVKKFVDNDNHLQEITYGYGCIDGHPTHL